MTNAATVRNAANLEAIMVGAAQPVTNQQVALAGAAKIASVAAQARAAFIDRESAIAALTAAICSGEHMIILGPPGTAKSKLVTFFSDALRLSTFRRVLNPDTTREDLVGPIDPTGLRSTPAVWDRCWAGLATSDFAFLDEVGKASNQVLNMLLDAMEERRVTSGNIDRPIPLHIAVGASNETLSDDVSAIWDRFSVRVVVGYLSSAGSLVRLLTDSNQAPIPVQVTADELEAMRTEARAMAARPSQPVVEMLVKLWSRLASITNDRVSDRRWKKVLTVAAGRALSHGRTEIEPADLMVAEDMLWSRVDDLRAVQAFVRDTVDEELADIQANQILVDELINAAAGARTLEDKSRVMFRSRRLLRDISGRNGRPEWEALREELRTVEESALSE